MGSSSKPEKQANQWRAECLRERARIARTARAYRETRSPHAALAELGITRGDRGKGRRHNSRAIADLYLRLLSEPVAAVIDFNYPDLLDLLAEIEEEIASDEHPSYGAVRDDGSIGRTRQLDRPGPMDPADALRNIAHLTGQSLPAAWDLLNRERRRRGAGNADFPLPPRPRR